jgi:hypothetical protein
MFIILFLDSPPEDIFTRNRQFEGTQKFRGAQKCQRGQISYRIVHFFRSHIKNFALIAPPLSTLQGKDSK